jgi:hypothetical protein
MKLITKNIIEYLLQNLLENSYSKSKITNAQPVIKCLLMDEQIDSHHLKSRKRGGLYSFKNIVAMHHSCHVGITHAIKQWFKYKYRKPK